MKLTDQEFKLFYDICEHWRFVNRNAPDKGSIHKNLLFATKQLENGKPLDATSMEEVDKAIVDYAQNCSDPVVCASVISLFEKISTGFESA